MKSQQGAKSKKQNNKKKKSKEKTERGRHCPFKRFSAYGV
jgi:hypothetical protein